VRHFHSPDGSTVLCCVHGCHGPCPPLWHYDVASMSIYVKKHSFYPGPISNAGALGFFVKWRHGRPVRRCNIFPDIYISPPAQNVAFQEVFSGHHHLILTASWLLAYRLVCSNFKTVLPFNVYDMVWYGMVGYDMIDYRKTSIKSRVPNNRRVSNKRRGFEACDLINAGSRLNARVSNKRPELFRVPAIH